MMAATLQPYRYLLIAFPPLAAGFAFVAEIFSWDKSCHDEFSPGPARHVGSHCLLADDDAIARAIRAGPVCAGCATRRKRARENRSRKELPPKTAPAHRSPPPGAPARPAAPPPHAAPPPAPPPPATVRPTAPPPTACYPADGRAVAAGDTTSARNASRSSARAESCADGATSHTSGSSEATGAPNRRTAIPVKERAASGRDKIGTDDPAPTAQPSTPPAGAEPNTMRRDERGRGRSGRDSGGPGGSGDRRKGRSARADAPDTRATTSGSAKREPRRRLARHRRSPHPHRRLPLGRCRQPLPPARTGPRPDPQPSTPGGRTAIPAERARLPSGPPTVAAPLPPPPRPPTRSLRPERAHRGHAASKISARAAGNPSRGPHRLHRAGPRHRGRSRAGSRSSGTTKRIASVSARATSGRSKSATTPATLWCGPTARRSSPSTVATAGCCDESAGTSAAAKSSIIDNGVAAAAAEAARSRQASRGRDRRLLRRSCRRR